MTTTSTNFFFKKNSYIEFRERKERGEEEQETLICYSTYLCIHWLILICTLTEDQTHNLGLSGQCSNQLSYSAMAAAPIYDKTSQESGNRGNKLQHNKGHI